MVPAPKWHKTQIYYNNWVIPGQAARVRRVADGLEFEVKSRVYSRLTHTTGIKHIADSSIRRVIVGRHAMVIEFDIDDQIFLRKEVLQDCTGLRLEHVLVGKDNDLMRAMLKEQSRLGGVSWRQGRNAASQEKAEWGMVGWYNIQPFVVGLAALVALIALKLSVCLLTGWWC
jgi:hypothetical protein